MSICRAAGRGDLDEVQRLVGHDPGLVNARIGKLRSTPLMRAAEKGHAEVVRWLVDQGVALDERDTDGNTAVSLASSCGHPPVVRLLLEGGGRPNRRQRQDVDSLDASISWWAPRDRALPPGPPYRRYHNQQSRPLGRDATLEGQLLGT
jgi:ankyrin repeat protein